MLPGTYTVTENGPTPAFDLTGLSCVDSDAVGTNSSGVTGTGIATINVDPGETVTCTFTNTKDAFIVVDKVTDPADELDVFGFDASWIVGDDDFQLADTTEPFTSDDLDPGNYSVAELDADGWDLTDTTCVSSIGDTETADDIELDAGETVTCTFTNTERGTIAIVKNADPEDPQDFSFSAGTGIGGVSTTDIPVVEVEPNDSIPGAQNVDGAGWNLVSNPDIGDRTTNTSTSIPHISILGTGNDTFDYYSFTVANAGDKAIFDIDYGYLAGGSFDPWLDLFDGAGLLLATSDDEVISSGQGGSVHGFDSYIEYTFSTPGVYVIRVGGFPELPVPTSGDYTLQISLENATGGTTFTLDDDGETDISPDTQVFTDVVPGVDFTVSEAPQTGWDLTNIECSGATGTTFDINGNEGTDTAAFEPGDTAVTINLASGDDTASCAFSNTKRGTINIVKNAVGGNDTETFTFVEDITETGNFELTPTPTPGTDTETFENVLPGTYVVSETELPQDWDLTNLECVSTNTTSTFSLTGSNVDTPDFELGDDTATINLAPGDTVNCTYTNTDRRGTIEIAAQAGENMLLQGFVAPQIVIEDGTFSYGSNIPDGGNFTIDTNGGTASTEFADLDPSNYFVTQTLVAGWELTDIYCISSREVSTFTYSGATVSPTTGFEPGDHTVNITLGAGDDGVSCMFTNVDRRGAITITKDTDPNDGQEFQFTENIVNDDPFTLYDDGDAEGNSLTFGDVLPGDTYSVTETQVPGWELTNILCTSTGGSTFTYTGANADPAFQPGDDTANVTLAPEDTDVNCTFTNTDRRGTIIIIKDAVPNSAQDFAFTEDITPEGPTAFTLDDDLGLGGDEATYSNTRTFENVLPGTYTVTEALVAGWVVSGINCTDANSTGSTDGTRTATVRLEANETVTCTFTNVTSQIQR